MPGKELTIVVSTKEREAVQRYYPHPTTFKYWSEFQAICTDKKFMRKVYAAWQMVLPREFGLFLPSSNFMKFFGNLEDDLKKTPLPVDWKLSYVVNRYLKNLGKGKKAFFKINSFRDYRATEIAANKTPRHRGSPKSADRMLSCPPFFEQLKFEAGTESGDLAKTKRGFQDTHLFLTPLLHEIFSLGDKNVQKDRLVDLFSWFEVDLEISVDNTGPDSLTLKVELKSLPLNSNGIDHKVWSFPGLDGILLSSPQVRKCVERLAAAWQNPALRKLLLIAPPGSGKEKLHELFRAARGVLDDTMKASIIATELTDHVALRAQILKIKQHLIKKKFQDSWQRPILLVDEIHQATKGERASLLRVLEDNKIILPRHAKDVSLKELIWLFAASESRSELLTEYKPPDFWTRMDQIIEMGHPLAFPDPEEGEFGDKREDVLADYFWLFWGGADRVNVEAAELDEVRRKILKDLLSPDAFRLAKAFAALVGSPLVEIFSIRYIRGMATRLRSEAILFGLQESPYGKVDFLEKTERRMKRWTTAAFMDMVKAKQTFNV